MMNSYCGMLIGILLLSCMILLLALAYSDTEINFLDNTIFKHTENGITNFRQTSLRKQMTNFFKETDDTNYCTIQRTHSEAFLSHKYSDSTDFAPLKRLRFCIEKIKIGIFIWPSNRQVPFDMGSK